MGEKIERPARASCPTKTHSRVADGSVLLEEASNLQRGLSRAEMAEVEVAQHTLFFAGPPGLVNPRQRNDGQRHPSKQIPENRF